MPRKPRKVRWMELGISMPGMPPTLPLPKEPAVPPPPPVEPPPAEAPPEATEPWWHVTEVLRFKCPLCGMLPEVHRLKNGPYEIGVKLQRFGGRLRGGKGYMVYQEVASEDAGPVKEEVREKLAELCRRLKEEG